MLLLLFLHLVSSEDIKVKPGEDATLPCRAPNDDPVLAIKWTRGDLKSEYVFLYRDGHSDPEKQHRSFMNRVQLMDNKIENGNLSLRLKNVMTGDIGTYECHIFQRTNRRKRDLFNTEPINIITLNVEGQRRHLGIILPVAALIVVLAAVVGFVMSKKPTGRFPVQSVDDPDVHQQLQEKENSQSKTITLNISDIQV